MNHRTKALWLPALVSLTVSAGLLAVIQIFALRNAVHLTRFAAFPYVLWLLCQPICGGFAAWLSKRAGGWRSEFMAASAFPAVAMLALFSIGLAIAVFVERNSYVTSHWKMVGVAVGGWVLLPGLGLLLGTIPFQHRSIQQR